MSVLFGLAAAAFMLWCCHRILDRLGFPGWWAAVALIPIANLIGLYLLATRPWPAEDSGRWPQ